TWRKRRKAVAPQAIDIAFAGAHACARWQGGVVYCWGANNRGQLGDGTVRDHARPTAIPSLRGAEEVALGTQHGCGRMSDGSVVCWGANDHGQLGDGTTVDRPSPVRASVAGPIVQLALGASTSCARTAGGDVTCWGEGPALHVDHAVEISAGTAHACA